MTTAFIISVAPVSSNRVAASTLTTMQNEVVAVDHSTGAVRWRSITGSGLPQTFGGTNVVLAGDVVAYGDRDVVGFDRSTGERLRTFVGGDSLPFLGGSPGIFLLATVGSRIFAGSSNGQAYAVSAADGSAAWSTQVGDPFGESVQDSGRWLVAAGGALLAVRQER